MSCDMGEYHHEVNAALGAFHQLQVIEHVLQVLLHEPDGQAIGRLDRLTEALVFVRRTRRRTGRLVNGNDQRGLRNLLPQHVQYQFVAGEHCQYQVEFAR